ncbi:MAG: CCA tRNA nucleotidyltransferase [Prevotella sp.]|nr:CCA tRNA nucleotidyltransferase [Bacteroides sp.]MCM1366751.1 CCA tRNA nucleotidyltransferase [Prevotella sp.]MCM1437370.1 CCA tRNA nucleotidyltransferase [Prevotella sp.]
MNLKDSLSNPIFKTIGQTADQLGLQTYVVGGYVRDIFLNRKSSDIDFVTVGSGIQLATAVAKKLGKGAHLSVFASFGTAQVKYHHLELEFVGARKESYSRNSRNPIVENGTLNDDQARRDFTVNALAISINNSTFGQLIDPFNGIDDLKAKILRTPLDPDITFSDDPLRMMRAIRFATQLQFQILPQTFQAIKLNKQRIEIITRERINDELTKIIKSPRPSIGFKILDMAGLLDIIFPELAALKGIQTIDGKGHKDNFLHTLQVLDNIAKVSDNEWLRWAALLHDIAKPITKQYDKTLGWTFRNHEFIGQKIIPKIFRKYKMPQNDKMKYVAKLVGMHMRPQSVAEQGVTDSGIRRLITDAATDLDDLMLLAEADITSKNPVKVANILNHFATLRQRIAQVIEKDDYRTWKNPIKGDEIIKTFGIAPSKIIGQLLQNIKDAILNCEIENTHQAAYQYLLKIAAQNGLHPKQQ